MNILISLHRGYGLGDAVMMLAVLKHVRKYRPEWVIDFQAEEGRHCVGRGIAHNTFVYGSSYPHEHYDGEFGILLYDKWYGWTDRPNTLVSSCLHETFNLPWDRTCGRYEIRIGNDAYRNAMSLVPRSAVALHYRGDSAANYKNLTPLHALSICHEIKSVGRVPLLIDWRNESVLPSESKGIQTVGRSFLSRKWGTSAEMNAAVISQCQAFIGIDSGPAKCASATNTPSLVIWTGHHPAKYHDPAPNTIHLVPEDYHDLPPICNDKGVVNWFENHYTVLKYRKGNDSHMIQQVKTWLEEVLK